MPVAVVDNVNTTPVIYYVQVDHLMRPARMTDASANWVWDVIFTPFGTTAYINQNPTVMNIRFPGQWFQLETGLAYNWYRHYDATIGRYVQPDPLLNDDGQVSIGGISTGLTSANPTISSGQAVPDAFGRLIADTLMPGMYPPRPLRPDGPSLYGYAKQQPASQDDSSRLYAVPSGQKYTPKPNNSNLQMCLNPWALVSTTNIGNMKLCFYRNFLSGKFGTATAMGGVCPYEPLNIQ